MHTKEAETSGTTTSPLLCIPIKTLKRFRRRVPVSVWPVQHVVGYHSIKSVCNFRLQLTEAKKQRQGPKQASSEVVLQQKQ